MSQASSTSASAEEAGSPAPEAAPGKAGTIVASVFLGPFGAFWAQRAASDAAKQGLPTQPYWRAFWISWLVSWTATVILAWLPLLVLILIGASMRDSEAMHNPMTSDYSSNAVTQPVQTSDPDDCGECGAGGTGDGAAADVRDGVTRIGKEMATYYVDNTDAVSLQRVDGEVSIARKISDGQLELTRMDGDFSDLYGLEISYTDSTNPAGSWVVSATDSSGDSSCTYSAAEGLTCS